jgi:endonuclease V-like protein UPF0215 family
VPVKQTPSGRFSNVVGIDDGPFERARDVLVVGAVFARQRLDGVLSTSVRRDGRNSTDKLIEVLGSARAYPGLSAILLQGIALAGFNVIEIERLSQTLERKVLVVARRKPNLRAIRRALLEKVPGGRAKWRLVERAGPMQPCAGVWVQRAGLDLAEAHALLTQHQSHGNLPEPLRVAHLVAGGLVRGQSTGRA